jgi:hypothetical protein
MTNDGVADESRPETDAFEVRVASRWKGRKREAVGMAALMGTVAYVAVLEGLTALLPHPAPGVLVSAAMIEAELFLLAAIGLQLTAGRYVQTGRSVGDEAPPPQSSHELRLRIAGYALMLSPLAVAAVVWFGCGLRVGKVRSNSFHGRDHLALTAAPDAHPLAAALVLAVAAFLCACAAIVFARLNIRPHGRTEAESTKEKSRKARAPLPETVPAQAPHASERHSEPLSGSGSTVPGAGAGYDRPDALLAVSFSGGGIRSAAFAFGGFGAVQARPLLLQQLDATVAVSGGSYAAAAIAITRTFDGQGNPRETPLPIEDIFSARSPELAYLRHNSRYLYQPAARATSGVLQLVAGAAINVFLALAVLRSIAWGLGWFLSTSHVLSGLVNGQPQFTLWPDGWLARLLTVMPLVATLGAIPVLLFLQAWRRARNDVVDEKGDGTKLSSQKWATQLALSGQLALVVAFGVVAVPGSIYGLSHLAYRNAPTPIVARAIVGLGLTNQVACEDAVYRSAEEAYASGTAQQKLVSGRVSVGYGACGSTGRIQFGGLGQPAPEPPDRAGVLRSASLGNGGGFGPQLAVIVLILGSVGALLARAMSVPASVNRRAAKVRRALVLRLPLALMAALGFWLFLDWTFRYASDPATQTALWSLLVVATCIIVSFLNPNLTSLHEFYRERLSSAFAVARRDSAPNTKAQMAEPLPYKRRYLLSELPRRPELVVCTTANINDQRVVPTRRFGVPMTFSCTSVRLEASADVESIGVRPMRVVERSRDGHHLSVMGTVAMSGAAVSPLMGRMAGKVSPFRLLLTLFNVRLGVWVKNPRWPMGEASSPWWAPQATNPQFQQLVNEAFGATHVDDRWLYLTDGGHLDNLGLVEAVRRLPDRILVLSASNDPDGTWRDLGAAVSVIRADLGIDLQVEDRDVPESDSWILLSANDPKPIQVLMVRAALTGTDADFAPLPIDVRSFGTRDPAFPHGSTGRQDFGDLEFESYRRLGQFLVERALDQAAPLFPS